MENTEPKTSMTWRHRQHIIIIIIITKFV